MPVQTISWEGGHGGHVRLIEQTLLPLRHEVLAVQDVPGMVDAIRRLAVRGAPAIGVAAAFGVVLGAQGPSGRSAQAVLGAALGAAEALARSRPTAVNLFWALERMRGVAERAAAEGHDGDGVFARLFDEAAAIHREDREICRKIGAAGAELLRDGQTVLTHCNAGGLATADYGTALAPIYVAAEQKKRVAVFADETRPLLQGARLTAWELMQAGIECTLITDGMAGRVMYEGKIDAVFVGADRIARNGDVCNKIGTYSVAVLARENGVPFYCCAPLSTFDPRLADGSQIPIEERAPEEITEGFGRRTAPAGVRVYNPAFDVTPARLVTGIVTEVGLIEAPTTAKVEAALRRGGRQGGFSVQIAPGRGRSVLTSSPAAAPERRSFTPMSIRKKSSTSSAPKKPARARAALPKVAPSTPDAMPPEVVEFITAIDEYKRKHQRPFPNWSEVLEIVKALGYSRE